MKITLVTNCDDWEGIYFDDVLMMEDHRLNIFEAMLLVQESQCPVEDVVRKFVDYNWLYDIGRLPKNLSDVVFEEE